jgi:hypothetical protein
MVRPSRRWKYSHQKMVLKPSTSIAWFTCRYSGVSRYLSKSSCQSAGESGGIAPTSGCHSTIDRPEWVSRVTPPTTTMAKTIAAQRKSHAATRRRAESFMPR